MKTHRPLLAAAVASIILLASGDALAQTVVATPQAFNDAPANLAINPWTFTMQSPRTSHLAAPAPGVQAMIFNVSALGVGSGSLTSMEFVVSGTVKSAELANYKLVYYPNGTSSPGVVVATNAGATFSPGGAASNIVLKLASPISYVGNFAGDFALIVDVNATTRSYHFVPRLQEVIVAAAGQTGAVRATEDLPLNGDFFYVN